MKLSTLRTELIGMRDHHRRFASEAMIREQTEPNAEVHKARAERDTLFANKLTVLLHRMDEDDEPHSEVPKGEP